MKRNILLISLAAIVAASCSNKPQSNTSILTGQLDSVKNGALLARVGKLNLMGAEFIDTIKLDENGKFTYVLQDNNYRDVLLMNCPSPGKKNHEEQKEYFQVVMLPGETVNVSGTLKNPIIEGKGFYSDKARAAEFLKEVDAELDQAKATMEKEDLNNFFKLWREKRDVAALEFIKANPDCNYSYYMAVSLNEPFRSQAMALLTDKVKEGPVKSFDEGLTAIMKANEERQKALQEAREKVAPGEVAPDFTLMDINGKPLSLSSLKGKYVILDFWGSWCSWCIKGIPEMKDYYKKYSGKFEILGIACGDSEEKWKKAVEENKLPWLNVINDEKGGTDVSKTYAISGYPTKIIIGPDGKIVKFIVGESPEFYKALDELFKK